MSISSVTSTIPTTATTAIRPSSTSSVERPPREASGDSVQLSKMGELMGQLQNLADADPAKAKEVLGKISESLSARASETGDSRMSEMADKFGQAAESGDLSGLEPPRGRPPGPPSRISAYQQQNESANPMQMMESAIANALRQ